MNQAHLFTQTIDCLATRWNGAAAILPGFALLAEGVPVSMDRLASACGLDLVDLDRTLRVVRHERDGKGQLIGLYGMSLHPTRHEINFENKRVYSCCALWAHAIPKLVGRAAIANSLDPVDGTEVRLEIEPGGVASYYPSTAVATMAVATTEQVNKDVGAAFCSHVHHLRSTHQAIRFVRGGANRHQVRIDTLNELASELLRSIHTAFASQVAERPGA